MPHILPACVTTHAYMCRARRAVRKSHGVACSALRAIMALRCACWGFEVLYGAVCAACCPNTAFHNHKAKDTHALND
eukprot:11676621-Alexandrium_andersonii.AAC.1